MRKPYPDDLNDKEWEQIKPILEKVKKVQGRPPVHDRREVLNALFYMLRTGCQWRHLPNDLPPWKAVYGQFLRWRQRGVLEQIHHTLRKELRTLMGRNPDPSAGVVDSQSAKTTERGALKGMTVERKLRVGKGIYLLTLRD
jgi:transposase